MEMKIMKAVQDQEFDQAQAKGWFMTYKKSKTTIQFANNQLVYFPFMTIIIRGQRGLFTTLSLCAVTTTEILTLH